MSQSFWEPDVAEETQPEIEQKAEAPVALSVSVDDFAALEERILRAVNLVKQERQARAVAEAGASQSEARAVKAETELHDQAPLMERLQAEIKSLKAERDHVKGRVERLLAQLDTLEL
jgi:predicted RNase H-like nuclease (RuvC/YqgF family)